jgi:ankyrin repeat protein
MRSVLKLTISALAFSLLAGCGTSPEEARQKLADLNIEYGEASFIEQASKGNATAVKLFLTSGMEAGVSSDGNTALMMAATSGSAETVELLLGAGANVNHKNGNGETALTVASREGCAEAARTLLTGGANPNAKVTSGRARGFTALMLASLGDINVNEGNCGKHVETVRVLLEGGAAPSGRKDRTSGPTALWCASRAGQVETVRILLEAGANPNAKMKNGDTALLQAVTAGSGVGPDVSVEERVETVRALLEGGANPNVEYRGGYTPMEVASKVGHTEVVRLLRETGARE